MALVEAQAAGLPSIASDAISQEADVGLGLIRKVNLHDGTERWVDLMLDQLRRPAVPWTERETALRRAGYDVSSLAGRLQEMYTHA